MDSLLVKCKSQWKAAFVGTFAAGILCYFYFMSNHFLTYDSLWNLHSDQDMIASGRQFLKYACGISSDYDLPAVNGLLAICYLALTAVLIVEIFDVRSNLCAVLIGGFLVTFPSVTSTFAYSFTVDGYMLSVLLTTLAFLITDKYRFGWIAGALLAGIGIGIYQAYFAYLIVLCIVKLLLDVIDEDVFRKIAEKILRYLLMGGLGYLFYTVSLRMMLTYKAVDLSGYQGTEKVLEFSLREIPRGLRTALDSFYQFMVWGNVFTTTGIMKSAYVVLVLLGGGLLCYRFVHRKRYLHVGRILLGILLIAGLPFGLNIICILSPDTYMHLLIRYAYVLLFVLVFVLADRLELTGPGKSWKKAAMAMTAAAGAVMILQFAVAANIAAFNMEERYEKTYALCIRLVDRLEQTEGYQTGDKVAVLGGFPSETQYPPTSITEQDMSGYFGVNGEYCVNATDKIAEFCAHYLNVTLSTVSMEQEIALTQTREFAEMPVFPEGASIRKIDDVWVVKLNG